ncbi:hypothetical protein HRI_002474900 [Hibiscus trionum]|uniref:Retrotransposon gag domain-containing protein n=1 Tax=Hibiscus trionum TaxID=183268 RepID=A0A9W7M595_HIBTR|nr:hypothetical protein HRI_002474900 [Hibiscus trionum]
MVNNADAIKALQEVSTCHDQTLVALQATVSENQVALKEVLQKLTTISNQWSQPNTSTVIQDGSSDSRAMRGKGKSREASEDGFPFSPKPVSVELPLFTGVDPEEWIASAQDFFDFYGTKDHHRVTMASFRMDGIAKKWFRWMQRQRQLAGWEHFIDAIRKRFVVTELESPEGLLTKLTQTATVEEYQTRFEDLVLRTHNLPDTFLTQCFISGLRADIKNEVLSQRVSTMSEAMQLARFHEARLSDLKRSLGRGFGPKPSSPSPPAGPRTMPGRPPPLDSSPKPSHPNAPQPRKLSAAEAQARRDKGLCYYCDTKFVPGHRCTDPQLFLLDDSAGEDISGDLATNPDVEVSDGVTREHSLVSLNALAGCFTPNTIRVTGEIHGRAVRILIDGGSTHNFM